MTLRTQRRRSGSSGGGTTCHVRHGPIRALGLILTVALLTSLLSSLAGAPVQTLAAGNEPNTPVNAGLQEGGSDEDSSVEETPVVEEPPIVEETPISEETPVVEETPAVEETPVAALEDPLTGGIGITMWTCESDHGGDLQQLYMNCQPAYDLAFGVYAGGALHASADGDYFATGLPAGEYAISGAVPPGNGDPLGFCGIGPTGAPPILNDIVVSDGSYTFTLGPNETIACDWFHVSQGSTASATFTARTCPAGVDIAAGTHDDFATACVGDIVDLSFTVAKSGEIIRTGRTSGSPSVAAWDDLPADITLRFSRAHREDYAQAVAFCNLIGATGEQSGYSRVNLQESGVFYFDLTLLPGETLACDWYNIPEPGRLTIYKYVCPEDATVDYYDVGKDGLGDRCPAYEGTEATFDLLSQTTGETETKHTDTDPNGGSTYGAYWDSVPAGLVTVTEHPWENYGTPRVFCGTAETGGISFTNVDVTGWSAGFAIPSGATMLCFWFNIPDQGGGVYLHKFDCPKGTDYHEATLEFLDRTCVPTPEKISFYLIDADGVDSSQSTDAGVILWTGVEAGEYALREEIPDGYGQPLVFCDSAKSEADLVFEQRPVIDGTVEFEHDGAGWYVICAFFNIPEADGSVTVVKYDCPVGTGYGLGGFDRYDERCNEPAEGVSFKLDGERTGNPGSMETGADGVAIWGDREADRYFLTEEVPAGFGKPVVFCDTYYPLDEQPPSFDPFTVSGDARIEFGLSEGQAILCVWFNVPANDYDDPGTVTVVKYWCDGDIVSATTCDRYSGGQRFVLRPASGGEAIELTTGANGAKTVAAPAGRWELDEVGREWCKASSAGIDQNGYLVVAENRETVVTVYNCGSKPEPQPVTKLPNTGSGDAASAPAIAGMTGGAAALGLLLAASSLLALANRRARPARGGDVRSA